MGYIEFKQVSYNGTKYFLDTTNILDALYLITCFVQLGLRASDFNESVYIQLATLKKDENVNKF